ncbi:MAG: permease [Spirochaetota bacterium]
MKNDRVIQKDRGVAGILKPLLAWALFFLGVLTVIYPRFAGHPLTPAYVYENLSDYTIWQIPFVYIFSYLSRAWGPLLFAFTLGGIIVAFVPREKMKRVMASGRVTSYFLAAALAPVLTVCSCAMIPIFGGLLISGVGIGPALTFLLMAPAANLLALIFTWQIISWKIMLFRAVFSFFGAIVIGFLVSRTPAGKEREREFAGIEALQAEEGHILRFKDKSWYSLREAGGLAKKVIPYLVAGVFLISFVEAYLPPAIVVRYMRGIKGVLLGAVIGVPTYTPTLVEVFLIRAMLNLGMEPASALAFLIGAPMASIPSMIGVSRIIGWKVVYKYALLAVLVAAAAGLIYLGWIKTL